MARSKQFPANIFLIFTLCFLAACSQKFQDSKATVQAAFKDHTSVITLDYIQSLPYASTLVTINNRPPILMILAFADITPSTGQLRLTWLSEDEASIVTENGRIIQTSGFDKGNLVGLSPVHSNILPMVGNAEDWQAIYDWSPGYRYQFDAQISQKSLGTEWVKSPLIENTLAEHMIESIVFNGLSNSQFENHFWLSQTTAGQAPQVIKSIQYLGPNMDKVEMLITKAFNPPALQQPNEGK